MALYEGEFSQSQMPLPKFQTKATSAYWVDMVSWKLFLATTDNACDAASVFLCKSSQGLLCFKSLKESRSSNSHFRPVSTNVKLIQIVNYINADCLLMEYLPWWPHWSWRLARWQSRLCVFESALRTLENISWSYWGRLVFYWMLWFYPLLLKASLESYLQFFKRIRPAHFWHFPTSSSSATLPVTNENRWGGNLEIWRRFPLWLPLGCPINKKWHEFCTKVWQAVFIAQALGNGAFIPSQQLMIVPDFYFGRPLVGCVPGAGLIMWL